MAQMTPRLTNADVMHGSRVDAETGRYVRCLHSRRDHLLDAENGSFLQFPSTMWRGVSIPGLLGFSGPPAIVFRVVAVWIDSIEGGIRRSLSHIFEERREFPPSLTYGYSSSSVSWIGLMRRVRASRVHARPASICRALAETMDPFVLAAPLGDQAAAGSSFP